MNVLKAAGTPMIRALSLMILLRFTLLPGLFSTKTPRLGSLSPILMNALAVLWKLLEGRAALSADLRRTEVEAMT